MKNASSDKIRKQLNGSVLVFTLIILFIILAAAIFSLAGASRNF